VNFLQACRSGLPAANSNSGRGREAAPTDVDEEVMRQHEFGSRRGRMAWTGALLLACSIASSRGAVDTDPRLKMFAPSFISMCRQKLTSSSKQRK